MKSHLQSFSPFHWFKKGSYQLLKNVCGQVLANRWEDWPAYNDHNSVDWAVKLQLKQQTKATIIEHRPPKWPCPLYNVSPNALYCHQVFQINLQVWSSISTLKRQTKFVADNILKFYYFSEIRVQLTLKVQMTAAVDNILKYISFV